MIIGMGKFWYNSKIKDSSNSNRYAGPLRWFVEIKELYIINTLFGDLDEESHKWQGVQFRFHPSAYHRDLIHVSPGSHIPTSLYIRKKDGGLLSKYQLHDQETHLAWKFSGWTWKRGNPNHQDVEEKLTWLHVQHWNEWVHVVWLWCRVRRRRFGAKTNWYFCSSTA